MTIFGVDLRRAEDAEPLVFEARNATRATGSATTRADSLGALAAGTGNFATALQAAQEAADITERTLPPDHPDVAHALGLLGTIQTSCRTTRRPDSPCCVRSRS